jgi:hypothetical protein
VVACGVGNELYWSVLEIGHIATYCSHAFADFLLSFVQFRLTPTSDEDIGAFFNEPRRLRR